MSNALLTVDDSYPPRQFDSRDPRVAKEKCDTPSACLAARLVGRLGLFGVLVLCGFCLFTFGIYPRSRTKPYYIKS